MSTRDTERIELLQGTLDLLILRTLLVGPRHGHAIAKSIEYNSAEVLLVGQGSLIWQTIVELLCVLGVKLRDDDEFAELEAGGNALFSSL
jgi:hypothetical protein